MPFHQFSPTITQSANQLWEVMCIADVKTQICMASTYLEIQWPRKSFNCHLRRPNSAPCVMRPEFFSTWSLQGWRSDESVPLPHRCGLGWNPRLCQFIVFFLPFRVLWFLSLHKKQHSRFQLIWKQWTMSLSVGCATANFNLFNLFQLILLKISKPNVGLV